MEKPFAVAFAAGMLAFAISCADICEPNSAKTSIDKPENIEKRQPPHFMPAYHDTTVLSISSGGERPDFMIWSRMKARMEGSGNDLRHFEASMPIGDWDVEFENGKTLQIREKSLYYEGKQINMNNYLNIVIDADEACPGAFILTFEEPWDPDAE